jgi:hypothetical protein
MLPQDYLPDTIFEQAILQCTNPENQVVQATDFNTVAPYVCGSSP